MRLLILTQKVDSDDPILGFFHRWIEEFAKHCEQVTVVALGVGEYHLPTNVRVFSLGKERGASRLQYIISFYRLIWRARKNYDVVFVHMNPIYVVLGGVLWCVLGKKIGLWYTHKHIDLKLRTAEKLADVIFTASVDSFRLESNKLEIVGHGIDTEIFRPVEGLRNEKFTIMTAGRISPVKDYETLIKATEVLVHKENIPVKINIVGGPATIADKNYFRKIKKLVQKKGLEDTIYFTGPVSNKDLSIKLAATDIFVNMSKTGSVDKAVLEAMSCGTPVITSNEAFNSVFGVDAPTLVFTAGNVDVCVQRVRTLRALSADDRNALSERLRTIVEKEHNIKVLIPRILSSYETS